MEKLDLKKTQKHLYQASAREVEQVDVPAINFLMIDGSGDPNTAPEYAHAVTALFTVAYTIKFMVKKGPLAIDYGVMPLEGLWWANDIRKFPTEDKSNWLWTMMIAQPPFVTRDMVDTAIAEVKKKKNPAAIAKLRFEVLTEGRCVQIMHIGPFSAEGPTIERLHRFIETSECQHRGKHHEIYLSDITKADPAKWKTIIRQPISPSLP